jgi:hypothetical protein
MQNAGTCKVADTSYGNLKLCAIIGIKTICNFLLRCFFVKHKIKKWSPHEIYVYPST